ncbi:hypothetical protein [Lysinibacter cavernae]
MTLSIVISIITLSGAAPTTAAYTAASHAKVTAQVNITPAYRMTCTTPSIDYGVTDEGRVYYGSGTSYVPVGEVGLLAGKKIVELVCNDKLMVGLDSLGAVYIWEIIPSLITRLAAPLNVGETFTKLTATLRSFSALTSMGRVFSFGSNQYGQLGNGDKNDGNTEWSRTPYLLQYPATLDGTILKDVAGTANGVVGLTTGGSVIQWGQTWDASSSVVPVSVNSDAMMKSTIVSVGGLFNAGLALDSEGNLFTWGYGLGLANGEQPIAQTPTKPIIVNSYGSISNRKVTKLFSQCSSTVFVVAQDNSLHAWGNGALGVNGMGSSLTAEVYTPTQVVTSGVLAGKTITKLFPGSFTTSAQVAQDAGLYWWGYGWFINSNSSTLPKVSIGGRQLIPQ